MISIDTTKTTNKNIIFFLPQQLKPLVTRLLRQQQISYESIFWKDVNQEKYATQLAHAKDQFLHAGWSGLNNRYGAIVSHIEPDELFRVCKQFFGPTMDKDYKQSQTKAEKKALSEYEQYHTNLDGKIPIVQN